MDEIGIAKRSGESLRMAYDTGCVLLSVTIPTVASPHSYQYVYL